MAFIREQEIRFISESDNVWVDAGPNNENRFQVIGTQVTCRVRDEETGRLRQLSHTIAPQYSLEDKETQELLEVTYKICEDHLKEDVAKLNAKIS